MQVDQLRLEPERLWFRSPEAPGGELDASPFLAALLMLSMRLAEPLHIEGPVSPLLVESVPRLSLVLRSWWPWLAEPGGLLAAVALAHGGLAEARVAGTLPLGNLVALGSHPLLDPLWSTEATRVVHHAPETTRVDKIAALGRRPGVLARLRVCDHTRPTGNCGRCGKCVRTMIGLELCGLSGSAPFDEPLMPGRIRRLSVRTSVERAFGEELLAAAGRRRRFDLADPLQLAFAADQAGRARRRAAVVARRWVRRQRDRISSRAP